MLSDLNGRLSVGRKLTLLLVVMLTIAVLSVGIVYYFQSQTDQLDNSIDVAGEQRMLTQQMTRFANQIAAGEADEETYARLEAAAARYETNLQTIEDGGTVDGKRLDPAPAGTHDRLATQREEWEEFRGHVDTILETEPTDPAFDRAIDHVAANEATLVDHHEDVVEAYRSHEEPERYETAIDVADRQRVLGQRIALTALYIDQHEARGDDGEDAAQARADLEAYLEAYEAGLTALEEGGEVDGREVAAPPPAVRSELDELRDVWEPYRDNATVVATTRKYDPTFVESHAYVQRHSDDLLETSDETVQAFTATSARQVRFMQALLLVLVGLNAAVFLGGRYFGRRYIGTPIADVAEAVASIGDGSLETDLSEETRRLSEVGNEGDPDEITRLVIATENMESYLATVVAQAQALARQDFDADVLDEDVPGEFGDALAEVHRELEDLIETFKAAVEHAGHSIYITNTNGVIEYANPASEQITGYSDEEVIGRTPKILKSGEQDEAFYADLWETILAGEIWESEIVNERKDGERYVVDQTIAPILDEDGEPKKFVAINQEVTERKERERRLRELHRSTRRLVTAEDREAVAELTARAAREILGYDSSVVRFVTDGVLEPVATTERAEVELGERPDYPLGGDNPPARALDRGEPLRYDDVTAVDDEYDRGETRSAMYLPIGDDGVLCITDSEPAAFDSSDVNLASVLASNTEAAMRRLDREQEIKRQNERLEQFGRTVAHDLRNPVQTVEGYLDVAKLAEDPAEAHDEIQRSIDRMSELIDELLELAKQGKTVISPSPASLEETAVAGWEQVRTESMELDIEADAEVLMDDTRVQQLLENLFRNAREHAGREATVRVGVLEDGFYVEDDGPGIPAGHRDDVFESGYTTNEDGTGFGLAIVKQIADAHNWSIDVTEGSDGGARFVFRNVEIAAMPGYT